MATILSIKDIEKTYKGGHKALSGVNLDIEEGELIALLGPNGAGKTTLISLICGIVTPTSGSVTVGGHDIITDYRQTRAMIGLVPQEISIEPFAKVKDAVAFSRGLFGLPRNDAYIEKVLKSLSLWDKRDAKIVTLSGGMKRRVLIAKALSHEPRVLFLDEPTAGVDVELRQDMWQVIEQLRQDGVTIILTTHYLEEAEAIADRIAVINKGQILLVERKDDLMTKMGQKHMVIELQEPIEALPDSLSDYNLTLGREGAELHYLYDTSAERTGITSLLNDLNTAGLVLRDVQTSQSSLEEIFVSLVSDRHETTGDVA
ncbi:MAG: ABC transporter ATP-binding protein [Alphaproteobacteria bacterium]